MSSGPDGSPITIPDGLFPLHLRPSRSTYIREIRERRMFAVRMPLHQMRAQNLNSALGMLWFLLNPLLLVAVYYIFFGLLLDTNRGVDNFLTFLAAGVFTYTFIQRSISSSSKTMITNVGLIRAIRFPRAILPIAEVVEQFFTQIPVILALLMVAIITGETPDVRWLVLAPLLLLQAVFALGAGFILARWTTVLRDVQNLLPFIFRLVFYMSGVLYSVENFVTDPTLRRLFYLNPFYDQIVLVRWAVLGYPASGWALIGAVAYALGALVLGFEYFRRGEPYGKA